LNDFFAVIISIKSSIAMVIVTAVARMKWIMFLGEFLEAYIEMC